MVKNKIMLVIRNFSFIKLLIFILLLLPMQVLADNVYMTCNQDVITKDSVSCSIKGNTTTTIIAVSLKVKTGSNITFKSFTPSSVWQGDGEDGNVDLYTANDILGKYDIGTLNLNVESLYQGLDTSITLYSVSVYDRDGKETKLDNYTKKIRIASNDNTLSSLNITGGLLNPTFSSNITTYSATVNTDRITINATANNDKAKVEGDIGTKKLNYGNNTFKINVLSESQETKTYTININRLNNGNTTTNNSGNTNNEKTTTNNNSGNTNNQSNNVQKSSNNYLKDIKLSYGNITLENDKFEYDLNIPYDIDSIDVNAITEDSNAKVEISGNNDLKVGLNQIKILVTAEDNTTKTYIINVTRKEEGYTLSNNNYISKLTITGYNLNFNKDILKYNLKIKKEKRLDINIGLEDSKSKYKIIGNDNLKNNSIIKIIVTAEDNTTRTYEIHIKNKDKIIKIIFISIITILILINIIRLVIKYRSEL